MIEKLINTSIVHFYQILKNSNINYNEHYDLFIRSLIVACGVETKEELLYYQTLLDDLLIDLEPFLVENTTDIEKARKIHEFLWKDFHSTGYLSYGCHVLRYLCEQGFVTIALENQINDPQGGVGDCVSLTGLYIILSLQILKEKNSIKLQYHDISENHYLYENNVNTIDFRSHVLTRLEYGDDMIIDVENTSIDGFNFDKVNHLETTPLYLLIELQLNKTINYFMVSKQLDKAYFYAKLNSDVHASNRSLFNLANVLIKIWIMKHCKLQSGYWNASISSKTFCNKMKYAMRPFLQTMWSRFTQS